ncbi:MAG: DUF4149 domain-containing protein [Nitrospirales bacterium]|nr:DUF4149 domain-containing protein [Nitrospirales bacterium]
MVKKRVNWGLIGFFVEVLGLTLWVGGLLVIIGIIIPTVFNSFGMEPAGRFLRKVFDGYGYMNLGILVVLGLSAGLRHRSYGLERHPVLSLSKAELGLLVGMMIATVSIVGVLGPKAVALQELAFEAVSKPEKEAAYADFFRLHMMVRGLHMVNLGMAAALLIMKLRRPVFHSMSTVPPPSFNAGNMSPKQEETR